MNKQNLTKDKLMKLIMKQGVSAYMGKYDKFPYQVNLSAPVWEMVQYDESIIQKFEKVNVIERTKDFFVSYVSEEKMPYKHGGYSPLPLHHLSVLSIY